MNQYLLFKTSLGKRLVSVQQVVEVIPMVALQRDASDHDSRQFCGLLNFRGQIMPVFSLAPFDERRDVMPDKFLIVTQTEKGHVAILAYEVDYLLGIDESDVTQLEMPMNNKTIAAAKYEEELIRLVNPEEFLA